MLCCFGLLFNIWSQRCVILSILWKKCLNWKYSIKRIIKILRWYFGLRLNTGFSLLIQFQKKLILVSFAWQFIIILYKHKESWRVRNDIYAKLVFQLSPERVIFFCKTLSNSCVVKEWRTVSSDGIGHWRAINVHSWFRYTYNSVLRNELNNVYKHRNWRNVIVQKLIRT